MPRSERLTLLYLALARRVLGICLWLLVLLPVGNSLVGFANTGEWFVRPWVLRVDIGLFSLTIVTWVWRASLLHSLKGSRWD